MKDIEIELQLKVDSTNELISFLKEHGTYNGEKHQVDEYFVPAHRNFLEARPVQEWLRLRDEKGVFSITYKNDHLDDQGRRTYCDEFETTLTDIESARKILAALTMKSVCTVNKTRDTWRFKDFEIALDTIEDLGTFVEIEYKGKGTADSVKKIRSEMIAFLTTHGCGTLRANNGGYPFMLLFPDEVTYEIVKE